MASPENHKQKKIAIMQPYFLPYIGYWQLIKSVDEFVVYDNIKYTKKGWINRNRFLQNGKDELFSISLRSGEDSLSVVERFISDEFQRKKLVSQLEGAYRKAPHFSENFPIFKQIIDNPEDNLFLYILNSIYVICDYLGIKTKITISSSLDIDHKNLKSQDKVLAICKELKANKYINAIGGTELYDKFVFKDNDIDLHFLKCKEIKYTQFTNDFVPWLSILDVAMFNSKDRIREMLNAYDIL